MIIPSKLLCGILTVLVIITVVILGRYMKSVEFFTSPSTVKPQGDACTSGLECYSGRCSNNVCAAGTPTGHTVGQSCTLQTDCISGLTCLNNICRQPLSAHCSQHPGSYDPVSGIACRSEVGTHSGVSSGNNDLGDTCALTNDCKTGLTCSNNVCSQPLSRFCIRNPNSYDPDSGVACSSEALTYSTDLNKRYHKELRGEGESGDRSDRLWGSGDRSDRSGDRSDRSGDRSGWSGDRSGWSWESGDRSDRSGDRSGWSDERSGSGNPSNWSGNGNRWRGSDKDEFDQLENMRPQKFNSGSNVDTSTMQPSYVSCNKYYNCKKQPDTDDDSCE